MLNHSSQKKPLIVSICGNIACGKTSCLQSLGKKFHKKCMLEGITDWGDILELSYQYPEKYSLPFQLRIVSEQTLQKKQIEKMEDDEVFIERSSDDGRHIFVNAKKFQGHLDDVMINEFDRWLNIHDMGIQPDLIIYLREQPEVCEKRIKTRLQAGDNSVDLQYLKLLHSFYEKRYLGKNSELIKDFEIPQYDKKENLLVLEKYPLDETVEKIMHWISLKKSEQNSYHSHLDI